MKLSRYTVILDANVLYSAPLRDLLLELAVGDLFRAKWTSEIEDEWVRSLLHDRPDIDEHKLRATCVKMRDSVLDCEVSGYGELIDGFALPDKDDRHVLAAAIHAKCDAIITYNLSDFPSEVVAKYDIEVLHPDDFLHFQFDLSEAAVITAVQRIRRRLIKPSISQRDYLDRMEGLGLPKIAAALKRFEAVL